MNMRDFCQATENTYITRKDRYYNIDNWKKERGKNILFITGIAGSGKSTLGKELSTKYNAEYIDMDIFMDGIKNKHMQWSDRRSFMHEMIDDFYSNDNFNIKREEYDNFTDYDRYTLIQNMMNWIFDYCGKRSTRLFVLEGIWIYVYMDYSFLQDKPLIIKGTSAYTSNLRAYKRGGYVPKDAYEKKSDFAVSKSHDMDVSKLIGYMDKNAKSSAAMESSLKSKIDNDYKPNGKMSLNKFKIQKVTEITPEMKKSSLTFFKHIDAKRDTTYMWLDGKEIVGVGSVRPVVSGGKTYNWITAIQVNPKYRGYGLGNQILKFCVSKLKGNALTVAIDNEVAMEMYKKHGFEISKESLEDVKAGRRKVYFMYL